MVRDQKSELATVNDDIQLIRDADPPRHQGKPHLRDLMNTGVTITGAMIALLLSIIGCLLA